MRKFATLSSDLQDEFALRVLTGQDPNYKGTYLDIGCGHGRHSNNTFVMDNLGWAGIIIDINKVEMDYNQTFRRAKCILDDATTCDWNVILDKRPEDTVRFDYISFDVDDATLVAVNRFPWSTVRFKVMTIEHDSYRVGTETRDRIRVLMQEHGYFLLAKDVCTTFDNLPFEDWYVDYKELPAESFLKYYSAGVRAVDVLYLPK